MSVIITGAASGIGLATAELFATQPLGEGPAQLLLADRDAEGLRKAAASFAKRLCCEKIATADLSDPGAGAAIVDAAIRRFGSLQALVSNAGAIHRVPLAELDAAAFDLMMAVNVRATLMLGQAAYPHLSTSRGAIVATASSAADHPAIPLGAYSTSKAALIMLVRQMAGEWGPAGIRCNCVSPGPTHTAMTAAAYDDPAVREARGQDIPMGRVGRPEDLARAIRFLAGRESDHISGINLRVDGALDAVLGVARSGAANRI